MCRRNFESIQRAVTIRINEDEKKKLDARVVCRRVADSVGCWPHGVNRARQNSCRRTLLNCRCRKPSKRWVPQTARLISRCSTKPGIRLIRPPRVMCVPSASPARFAESCEFHLGVGGTYHSFESTGGVVIPMTMSWDRSRWEFGFFISASKLLTTTTRMSNALVARPYWGASLSRRFTLLRARSIARDFWIRRCRTAPSRTC